MVAMRDALMMIRIIVDVAVICAAVEAINEAAVAAEVVLRRHTEVDTEIHEAEVPLVRVLTMTITHLVATQASEQVEEQTQRMKTVVLLAMEVQQKKKHLERNSLSKGAKGMAHEKAIVRRPSRSTLAICLSPSIEINFEAPSTSLVRCSTRQ